MFLIPGARATILTVSSRCNNMFALERKRSADYALRPRTILTHYPCPAGHRDEQRFQHSYLSTARSPLDSPRLHRPRPQAHTNRARADPRNTRVSSQRPGPSRLGPSAPRGQTGTSIDLSAIVGAEPVRIPAVLWWPDSCAPPEPARTKGYKVSRLKSTHYRSQLKNEPARPLSRALPPY